MILLTILALILILLTVMTVAPNAILNASFARRFCGIPSVIEINELRTKNGVRRKKRFRYVANQACRMANIIV